MGSKDRGLRIREKYELEQKHIEYLLAKKLHPLEIADQMTHYMITMLREAIKIQHPEWNELEILTEMRKEIDFNKELQKRRSLR
jgi:hypothetical protein